MPNWKKLIVSGSDASLNTLNVTTAFTASGLNYPTSDGTLGQVISTDGNGNLSFSSVSGGGTALIISGSTAGGTQISQNTFTKLQFDSDTGLHLDSLDSGATALVSIGSHYRDIIVDGQTTLVATGSDQLEFVAGNGVNITTSTSDTNSNSYAKEIQFSIFPYSGSAQITGSLGITGSLEVDGLNLNGITYPTADGTDGQALITDGDGTLTFDDIKVYATVKNISGGTLYKGTPVHATASASPPSGQVVEIIAASASVASTMPATFVLDEDLVDEAEGRAISSGYIKGVDTSAFTVGEVVYVGVNGGYTNVKPTGDSNLIQNLGVITRVDASNGAGFIYGSGRSNDVPNLPTGKVWVGSSNYSVTSSVVHLDEANGRLGINTDTPGTPLDVNGTIRVSNTGSDKKLQFLRTGGNTFSIEHDSGRIYFYNETTTSAILSMLNGGRVGIGTNSPTTTLDVSTTGSHGITLSKDTSNTTNSGRLFFETDTASEGFAFLNSNGLMTIRSGAQSGATSGTVRVAIDGAGKVGIGTTNPTKELTVVGSISSSLDLFVDGEVRTDIVKSRTYPSTNYLDLEDDFVTNGNGTSLFSVSSTVFGIDSNNNATNDSFKWIADGANASSGTELMTLTDEGDLSITGDITGSSNMTIGGNLIVEGTGSFNYIQSVTGSAKIIGDAYIILNNNTPAERYAGIVVQDSGSAGVTASLEFDGQTNDWFYEYSDDGGVTTDHGVVMFGPEYNTKGSPAYPTVNTILKGNGSHHVEDTNITDDGNTITLDSTLYVTQSRVGIGTTSPAVPLHVDGFGRFNGGIQLDGNNRTIYAIDNTNLLLGTNNTERMRIDSSGNVGIGVTSPARELHISGSGNVYTRVSADAGSNAALELVETGGQIWTLVNEGSTNAFKLTNSGGTRFYIAEDGNVGIGTTSAGEKLDVAGSVKIGNLKIQNAASGRIGFNRNTATGTIYDSNNGAYQLQHNNVGYLELQSYNSSGVFQDHLVFTEAGSLGIGISAPTKKLHVDGDISGSDTFINDWGSVSASLASIQQAGGVNGGGASTRVAYWSDGDTLTSDADFTFNATNNTLGLTNTADNGKSINVTDGTSWLGIVPSLGSGGYTGLSAAGDIGLIFSIDNDNTTDSTTNGLLIAPHTQTSGGLKILENGNVGIGTSSPSAKLHVYSSGNGELEVERASGALINLQAQASLGSIGTDSNHPLHLKTNAGTRLAITTAGSVGIGTTSPTAFVQIARDETHVSGDINIGDSFLDLYNTWNSDTDEKGAILTFSDSYYDGVGQQRTTRAAIKGGTDTTGNSSNGFLAFYTDSSSANSATERMRINSSGNVGILQTSPQGDIHIGNNDGNRKIILHGANSQANSSEIIFADAAAGGNVTAPTYAGMGIRFNSSNNYLSIRSFWDNTTTVDYEVVSFNRASLASTFYGDVYLKSARLNYQENTDVDSAAAETIATVNTGSFTGAFFDYTCVSGSNARVGTVMAVNLGGSVEYTETSTGDIGDTSAVTLSVDISGANMRLRATTTTDNWAIKSIVRTL